MPPLPSPAALASPGNRPATRRESARFQGHALHEHSDAIDLSGTRFRASCWPSGVPPPFVAALPGGESIPPEHPPDSSGRVVEPERTMAVPVRTADAGLKEKWFDGESFPRTIVVPFPGVRARGSPTKRSWPGTADAACAGMARPAGVLISSVRLGDAGRLDGQLLTHCGGYTPFEFSSRRLPAGREGR